MNYKEHLFVGLFVWVLLIAFVYQVLFFPSLVFLAGTFIAVLLGAVLPDIDTDKSKIGRAFEKLYFLPLIGLGAYLTYINVHSFSVPIVLMVFLTWLIIVKTVYDEFINEHRTKEWYGTHALKAGLFFSLLLFFVLDKVGFEFPVWVAFSLFLGYFSHLVMDKELRI